MRTREGSNENKGKGNERKGMKKNMETNKLRKGGRSEYY